MKKIAIYIVFVIFFNIFTIQPVFAASDTRGILEQAQDFIDLGEKPVTLIPGTNPNEIHSEAFEELAGMLQGLGILIAIGTAIVLGIRFLMASASRKSEIMQSATPFLVGTIIILGALTIWKLLINVLDVL